MRTKLYFKNSLIVIFTIFLSGCAFMSSYSQEHQLEKNCEVSSMLLTDLTTTTEQRHYMLPNRQLCPTRR